MKTKKIEKEKIFKLVEEHLKSTCPHKITKAIKINISFCARLFGMNYFTLHSYFNGRNLLSAKSLILMANVLGWEVNELAEYLGLRIEEMN